MTRTHYMYLGVTGFLLIIVGILGFLLICETHRPVETITAIQPPFTTPIMSTTSVEKTDTPVELPPTVTPPATPATTTLSWESLPSNSLYSNSAIDTALQNCLDTDSSTYGMIQCSEVAKKQYDAIVDKIYTALNKELDTKSADTEEDSKNSALSEKANIASTTEQFVLYRNSLCAAAYDEASGGTIRSLYHASCYLNLTRAHIQALCTLGEGLRACKTIAPF